MSKEKLTLEDFRYVADMFRRKAIPMPCYAHIPNEHKEHAKALVAANPRYKIVEEYEDYFIIAIEGA